MEAVSKRCLFTSVLAQMPMFLCFDTNISVGVGYTRFYASPHRAVKSFWTHITHSLVLWCLVLKHFILRVFHPLVLFLYNCAPVIPACTFLAELCNGVKVSRCEKLSKFGWGT